MKQSQEADPMVEKEGKKKKEYIPEPILVLRKELEEFSKIDDKIKHLLQFMRSSLAEKPKPAIGFFWKARLLCMPLFKENLAQGVRSTLWKEYLELMQEARHLKEILDEQSAFAVEQIELAIKALEENLDTFESLLAKSQEIVLPSFADKELEKNKVLYQKIQKELVLLNSFASRVHSLRKEVIQTGMRLRYKNIFFQRLSDCGDRIFPKRRKLIKTLSDTFIEDVNLFVESYFNKKTKVANNYVIREEIKAFQEMAKILTLNTVAFSKTRSHLSHAWDELKEKDKERKMKRAKKRETFQQNVDQVMEKIKPFAEKCAFAVSASEEIEKEEKEILSLMREIELGREDVKALKEEIKKAKKPFFERQLAEEKEEEEKQKEKRDRVSQELERVVEVCSSLTLEEIKEKQKRLIQEVETLSLSDAESLRFTHLFRQLQDICSQKRKEEVFQKEGEPDFLDSLYELLKEKEEQRQKSKLKLEEIRKAIGGSGLDFEKSMQLNDLFEEEKERLEKIDEAIEKIESHIAKFQK